MKLMTEEVAKLIPKLGETDGKSMEERTVPVKFFDPTGRFTYYVLEFDGDDTLFGYCVSPLGEDCDELGYASLAELQAVRGRFGLGLERDLHWNPQTPLTKAVPGLAK